NWGILCESGCRVFGWPAPEYRVHQFAGAGADPGFRWGIQGAIQQLGGGMGQILRWSHQFQHQIGKQYVAWRGLRIFACQDPERQRSLLEGLGNRVWPKE